MSIRAHIAAIGATLAVNVPLFAFVAPPSSAPIAPSYDSREEASALPAKLRGESLDAATRRLEEHFGIRLRLTVEPIRGVPKSLAPIDPTDRLTRASSDDPVAIARAFLLAQHDLYSLSPEEVAGLPVETAFATKDRGWTHVWFQQELGGAKVYAGRIGVHVDGDGRILAVNAGPYVAGLSAPGRVTLPAGQAVILAARYIDEPFTPAEHLLPIEDGPTHAVFEGGHFGASIVADLVFFPTRDGARLGWYVILDASRYPAMYEQIIDAETGALLYRFNLTQYAQTASAYAIHPEQTPTRQIWDLSAAANPNSPLGWVEAGTQVTHSNNVIAHEDPGDPINACPGGQGPVFIDVPAQPTQDFLFPVDLTQPPAAYIDAAITNLFVINNFYHDRLYGYGFDEPAGNFQADNRGLGGVGNDRVDAQAQDKRSCGTANNANFSTPVDGGAGRMQMYIWTGPEPDRDGDLDADVIIHEYSHGLSNRLVGGPGCVGGCALGQPQSGGMGESWGDQMAASISDQDATGEYSVNDPTGIRNYSFGASPLTYRNLGQVAGPNTCQVHADGEVWSAAIWDIRENFMAYYGATIAAPKHERYLVDSMKLMSFPPSFLDAKAGMLLATGANTVDRCLMELGFAKRGMGANASGPGAACPTPANPVVEDFSPPPGCNCVAPSAPASVTVAATAANELTVSWPAAAGASFYYIDRADAATCGGAATSSRIARVMAPATNYIDRNALQGGVSYAYQVTAVGQWGTSCPATAVCNAGIATGNCTLKPVFAGIRDAGAGSNCSAQLSWSAAVSSCPLASGITYNIYRSNTLPVPVTTPFATTTATSFTDSGLSGTPYHYVVRAEDSNTGNPGPTNGGNEDDTLTFVTVVPGDRTAVVAQFDFEAATDEGWTQTTTTCGAGGVATGTWQRANPIGTVGAGPASPEDDHTPGAGVTCWTTQNCAAPGCTVGNSDIDNSTQYVLSPAFDCSGAQACYTSFWLWFYKTPGFAGVQAMTEASNDGGTTWVALTNVESVNAAGAVTNQWNRLEYDLAQVPGLTLTANMRIRISAADCVATIVEAAVDDFLVERGQPCAGCVPGAPSLVPNRLFAVKRGFGLSRWVLTSFDSTGRWNLHGTVNKTRIPMLFMDPVTASTTTKVIDDPGDFLIGYYRTYGADNCTGVSVP